MSLRHRVLQGGLYLALRQGLGMIIGLGGVVILTRLIGPQNYGIYASILGLYGYLFSLSQLGINVYLIRRSGDLPNDMLNKAFTLLILTGLFFSATACTFSGIIESWLHIDGFQQYSIGMFLGLLPNLLSIPAVAILERGLFYRFIAWIDLVGQITFYIISLPLAFRGFGVWAPISGWWVQQLVVLMLYYRFSQYRPKLSLDFTNLKEMIIYGLSYSSSIWVWQLRSLVNPLIVGRFGGAEVVGYIALAIKIVETLSFVKNATWRLSIAALSKIQDNKQKLINAISEGMQLQVLALGPILVLFGVMAPMIIENFFGDRWIKMLEIYPFIALSYLVNSMFNLHSSVLYVLRKNHEVTIFHIIHISIFMLVAYYLLPLIGYSGYGWAEVAALSSYYIIHRFTAGQIGIPTYFNSIIWVLTCGFGLLFQKIGWMSLLPLAIYISKSGIWRDVFLLVRTVKGVRA